MRKSNIYLLKNRPLTVLTIKDEEVVRVLELREAKNFLKTRLKNVECDLDKFEIDLIRKIELHAVAATKRQLSIQQTERRFPSWKGEFINIAGQDAAEKILENTIPQIYKSLIITD